MESVYALWEKLDRIPAEQTDEAISQLALGLQSLLRADNVRWFAAVRVVKGVQSRHDALLGWRLRASYNLVPDSPRYQKLIAWWFQNKQDLDPNFQIGLATHAIIAKAGKFQVHRMRDGWIPFAEFAASDHYRLHYTENGILDRIWLSLPLNEDAESIFLIDRTHSRRFTKREAETASMLLRGIVWFHRRLFLNHGLLIANAPMSPMARSVLRGLLTGKPEKQIAAAMNQKVTTTHKYITSIYEHFGVNGRAELMSLWLGR